MATRPAGLDTGDARPGPDDLEAHRRDLTGYCYRMLGSGFEAEDAVQETMVRAWRSMDRFEGRSALRSWLYRIATNVCLDMLREPQRRARPMDFGPPSTADGTLGPAVPEHAWVMPVADAAVLSGEGDPAELLAAKESIRLAFVAALQHLPPRQRAVLILREVLRWQASEVAGLLETSVPSVNSALQRARATLTARGVASGAADAAGVSGGLGAASALEDRQQEDLLARYVDAWERYDITSLVSLLQEDATQTMPPHELWLVGAREIGRWLLGPGAGCRGGRILPTRANGCAAFGLYRISGPHTHAPFSLQIVEVEGDRISGLHNFLYPELFPAFGLPDRLEH